MTVWATQPLLPGKPRSAKAPAWKPSAGYVPGPEEQGDGPGDPNDHEGGIDLRAAARSVAELAFDLDVLVACAVLEGACGPLPDVPARSCTTVFSPSYLAGLGDIAPLHR